jgi:hypothetical protein
MNIINFVSNNSISAFVFYGYYWETDDNIFFNFDSIFYVWETKNEIEKKSKFPCFIMTLIVLMEEYKKSWRKFEYNFGSHLEYIS